ncbi:hypothetical protein DPEC_G00155990 [Dallia pectoralis]|uniref:Uncharacterized protein n=1 Tax=Dallia pectoralis TaxID=75939 RepID=A0ACC2GK89_DALPE|nr:hypothetical protein DPEC_G00155990 [Dallia pectoralis]
MNSNHMNTLQTTLTQAARLANPGPVPQTNSGLVPQHNPWQVLQPSPHQDPLWFSLRPVPQSSELLFPHLSPHQDDDKCWSDTVFLEDSSGERSDTECATVSAKHKKKGRHHQGYSEKINSIYYIDF